MLNNFKMAFKGKQKKDQTRLELPTGIRSNSSDAESIREMSPLRKGRASLSLSLGRRKRMSEVSVCSLSSLMKLDTVQYINLNKQIPLRRENIPLDREDSICVCSPADHDQGM